MKKLIAAAAAAAVMAGSAYAAEWNFYGSARVETFYQDNETIGAGSDPTGTYISESLQGEAHIGAEVRVSDELTGGFEYGAEDGKANIRHLYGEWTFGAGSLLVGHTDGPLGIAFSSQAYNEDMGLGGYGDCDMSRVDLLMLTFGGFKIAAVAPDTSFENSGAAPGATEVKIPRIAASYTYDFNNGAFVIGGAYNSFEIDNQYDVNSYAIGAGVEATFGPVMLAGTVVMGENAANVIGVETGGLNGQAEYTGTRVLDNEIKGFTLVAAYTVNDMFGLEVGYGFIEEEVDGKEDNEACSYYIQAPITLAPGVTIIPEIGKIDEEENGENETVYYGAKWQINF